MAPATEDRAARQCEQAGPRQGESGAEHIDNQKQQAGRDKVAVDPECQALLASLQLGEAQIVAEIERKKGADKPPHHQQEQQTCSFHWVPLLESVGRTGCTGS